MVGVVGVGVVVIVVVVVELVSPFLLGTNVKH